MKIEFSPPDISEMSIQEVADTLRSGWITTGPKTKLLEKEIAEYTHAAKVVCLNSATAALELALRLLGVGEGDEVITSAYTYTASASVIQHVGAKIVLVDTGVNSFHMDYDQLERAITGKTKVIIPVDVAGIMCDYDKLFEIVNRRKDQFTPSNPMQQALGRICILADAAHSLGATYKGKQSGEVADFTSFSFHAVKNLTTAEGGAIAWRAIPGIDDCDVYTQFMLWSLHGHSKDALAQTKLGAWECDIVCLGYKCNMMDVVAALGLRQLKRYPEILAKRKQIVEYYDQGLAGCAVDVLRHYGNDFSSSGHLYLARLLGKDENDRNSIIEKMAERGIATNVHYKPLPMHTAYKKLGFDIKDYPNAFNMYRNEITLPLHNLLTDEQMEYVVSNFKELICQK